MINKIKTLILFSLMYATVKGCKLEKEKVLKKQNIQVTYSDGKKVGSVATFTCNEGFELASGDLMRTCERQDDGTKEWSGTRPKCTAIKCKKLKKIKNGKLNFSNKNKIGSVASFTCNDGYTLEGDSSRTCQLTGDKADWSGTMPECKAQESEETLIYDYNNQEEFDIESHSIVRPDDPSESAEDALEGSGSSVSLSPDKCILIELKPGNKTDFRVLKVQATIEQSTTGHLGGSVRFVLEDQNIGMPVNLPPGGDQITVDSSNFFLEGGLEGVQSIYIQFDDDVEVSEITIKACCPIDPSP